MQFLSMSTSIDSDLNSDLCHDFSDIHPILAMLNSSSSEEELDAEFVGVSDKEMSSDVDDNDDFPVGARMERSTVRWGLSGPILGDV